MRTMITIINNNLDLEKEDKVYLGTCQIASNVYLTNPKYLINNLYIFGWESDYAALTKSGYWYEVEVKISRSDFFADFKKAEKHDILSGRENGLRPNYFAYCVPGGMVSMDEVPEYAGLYYVNQYGNCTCPKLPSMLHPEKLLSEQLNLTDKFYHNYKNLLEYRRTQKQREGELRAKISHLRAEYKAATGYDITEIF